MASTHVTPVRPPPNPNANVPSAVHNSAFRLGYLAARLELEDDFDLESMPSLGEAASEDGHDDDQTTQIEEGTRSEAYSDLWSQAVQSLAPSMIKKFEFVNSRPAAKVAFAKMCYSIETTTRYTFFMSRKGIYGQFMTRYTWPRSRSHKKRKGVGRFVMLS